MSLQNFMILAQYKLHNYKSTNEMMLNSCSPVGLAAKLSIFSALQHLCLLFIVIRRYLRLFLPSNDALQFYGKHTFVWFCYLVVFINTLFFCKRLPVLSVFCC